MVFMILPSSENDPMDQGYGRYAHSGIRVRPKTRTNDKFKKRTIYLKDSSPDSKADFSEKLLFGNWRLMLGRYDIILNI